ncbi:glycosyltransferase family 1 protein [bacterium]|nr:glycosyltransferase family 1 protein [bacterium]
MIFALCCAGTWGDVAPFLEIAGALQSRGHRVVVLAPAPYASQAARRNLQLVPTLSTPQMQKWLEHPAMWDHRRFFSPLLEYLMEPSILPILSWVGAQPPEQLLVVSDYSSSPAARLACERTGARHITAWRDPAGLRSRLSPSAISGADFLGCDRPSRWLREAIFWASDLLAWYKLGPTFRRLGFRPPLRLLEWMVSPQGSLGLFPDWYAPPPADWPAGFQCAGFPRSLQSSSLPASVERFLQAGPPPWVATLGSAARGFHRQLAWIRQEARRRQQRLVLLGPDLEPLGGDPNVLLAGFAPLSPLLRRASVFLHHGGIGTSAEALAAGLPQLVLPLAHDQFDNARRLVRLGQARCLPLYRLTPTRLRQQLDLLPPAGPARLDPAEQVLERICLLLEKQAGSAWPRT